jgi:2-aminoethylphosphonate-pyruvate transaminase
VSDREWILLNPGPANTSREVRDALVMPDLCHREPEFFEVMRECRERLVRLCEGGDGFAAVLFTGSGTAAVEAAVASAVPDDGGLLVVDNGVYGDRLLRIARAHGLVHRALSCDVATPARPDDVRDALRADRRLTHVAVVHHETTTGVLNPVAEIVRAAAGEGRRVLVDAMSSLFGEPLDVTQDGIDFVMASANKCLQGVPGISFVLARRSALDALRGRPRRFGFEILVPEGARSSILTTFRLPAGIAYDPLHDAMKRRGYIIYAGQGDIRTYAFRVSNMGTLTPRDMPGVVEAFAASLADVRGAGR